jgi:hypothetical protein
MGTLGGDYGDFGAHGDAGTSIDGDNHCTKLGTSDIKGPTK